MAKTRTEIQAKYDANNRKTYSLKLNVKYDADIIEKLDSIESKNGYIRDLIRQDIARTGSVPGSSVPVSSVPEKQMTVKQIISFLEKQTGVFDGSMYELLNAITSEYMGN